jgi:hypothetical protein
MGTRSDDAWSETGQTGTGEPRSTEPAEPRSTITGTFSGVDSPAEEEGHGPAQDGTRGDMGVGGPVVPPQAWADRSTDRGPAGTDTAASGDTSVSGGAPDPEYGDPDATMDAIVSGATTRTDRGSGGANRSGSGGSGGPSEPDESVDGSAGRSMDELLTGE